MILIGSPDVPVKKKRDYQHELIVSKPCFPETDAVADDALSVVVEDGTDRADDRPVLELR